jgi:hypothetical protein
MNDVKPFNFQQFSNLGDTIRCKILTYQKNNGKEILLLTDVSLNWKEYPGTYSFFISNTNGYLLNKIFPHDVAGYPIMAGKPARLIFTEYETVGYNGRRFKNRSYLFQPLEGRIMEGEDWRIIY